jgi:hypothetical protein
MHHLNLAAAGGKLTARDARRLRQKRQLGLLEPGPWTRPRKRAKGAPV